MGLMHPSTGITIYDQEGGWPFGLERMLRKAAQRHGLHFYVRRGPFWTNVDYVLSVCELEDDVSVDLLQRDVRLVFLALFLYPLAVVAAFHAVRTGAIPAEVVPAL